LVRSAAHFVERHGLVVILALGESIVAIGVGVRVALDWPVVAGAALAISIAVGLWFAYFNRLLDNLEERLSELDGRERAKMAREVFTYLEPDASCDEEEMTPA
jgi:low temperature requirement protein LtrA